MQLPTARLIKNWDAVANRVDSLTQKYVERKLFLKCRVPVANAKFAD